MQALTQSDFMTKVGQDSGIVLLDFRAERCGPCRILKPQLQDLSHSFVGKVNFYAVDVDSEWDLAMQFAIRSIPTVMIFVNGQIKDKIIGVQPIEAYAEKLHQYANELLVASGTSSSWGKTLHEEDSSAIA